MNLNAMVQFLLPEILLTGCALLVLAWSTCASRKGFFGLVSVFGIVLAALLLPRSFQAGEDMVLPLLTSDAYSAFGRAVVLLVSGLGVLLSMA